MNSTLVCRASRGRVVSTAAKQQHSMPIRKTGFLHTMTTRHRDRQVVCQGLFGLGVPEIAVIAGVVALIYGT